MEHLSVGSQKKKAAASLVAAGALFIMIPVMAAWFSPFNARAGQDGPAGTSAQAAAPSELKLAALEQVGAGLSDELAAAGRQAARDAVADAGTAAVNSLIAQAQPGDAAGGEPPATDPAAGTAADGTAPTDGTSPADSDVGGAVTGFWSLAWSKAWPPIKNILTGLWTLTKTVFLALWSIVRDVGDSVNANMNTNSAGSIDAPVNAAP